VANVATTGTFTIPLMKKTGYRPEIAGAVEAVASSGGQIMPPIMWAAAFIMADFLKVSFLSVVLAATIPAVLYYVALFFVVDLEAAKGGLKGLPRAELPSAKSTLLKSGYLLVPICVLIFLLGVVRYSPQKAAFFTIVLLIAIASIGAHTRMTPKKLLKALIRGGLGGLEVAAVCACAGIAIGIIMRSGLGFTLTGILIELSHGNLLVLMILTMLVSTIMGMGLPTSACYIIVAVLIAPAMVQLGVVPIAAHLFAFYYATLSAITPPVALASYAAAAVAGAPPMAVGWQSFRIGLTGFIVPYMFVFGPSLLMIGEPHKVAIAFLTASLGTFALAISLVGTLFTKVPSFIRAMAFIAAMLLIKPGLSTDLGGVTILSAIVVVNWLQMKK
jgi:TRAP transporter 4TM/12TM fusion protein